MEKKETQQRKKKQKPKRRKKQPRQMDWAKAMRYSHHAIGDSQKNIREKRERPMRWLVGSGTERKFGKGRANGWLLLKMRMQTDNKKAKNKKKRKKISKREMQR
jgi:hypothetical protein